MTHPVKMMPLERIARPTYDEFYQEYDLPQRPVVITGATVDWKAVGLWTHEWFAQHYGSTDVALTRERTHTVPVTTLKLRDYIARILAGEDRGLYMDQFGFKQIPELAQYVRTPYASRQRRNVELHLWLGPAGTIISLHKDNHVDFDYTDNIFAQIHGRKRVVLVSPDQDHLMYQRSKEQGAHWHSQVDWENPDFERFPLFRDVVLQETILEPGEIVFIPGNYWHSLRSLDPSISVSCWWRVLRIADVVVTAMNRLQDPSIAPDRITLRDIEEYGGIPRAAESLRGDNLPADMRNLIWSVMDPEVRQAIDHWRDPRSLPDAGRGDRAASVAP